jgi:hypothetical protein
MGTPLPGPAGDAQPSLHWTPHRDGEWILAALTRVDGVSAAITTLPQFTCPRLRFGHEAVRDKLHTTSLDAVEFALLERNGQIGVIVKRDRVEPVDSR